MEQRLHEGAGAPVHSGAEVEAPAVPGERVF